MNSDTTDAVLAPLRREIDAVDNELIDLLARRMDIVRRVAALKIEHGIAAVLEKRIEAVIDRNSARGAPLGLDAGLIRDLYTRIIEDACRIEEQLMQDAHA